MLTRGHLIGQIVDELALISAQAKQRARLHLFDIHTYVEDFAKEVLNRALNLGLSNLNTGHFNNSGLDLGDATHGWAFQITADKSTAKVKETLEKIDTEQHKKFPNIRILVIGEKQTTYTFTGEPYESFGFKPDMVWDFNDICREIMTLPIEKLDNLAKYVSSETRRVQIELEIPDQMGHFPTSIDNLLETIPQRRLSDATKMEKYFSNNNDDFNRIAAKKAIEELSDKLVKLPRLTREVFAFFVERKDEQTVPVDDTFRISAPKLRRIYHGDDLDGDLSLLIEAGLIDFNEPNMAGGPSYWTILFPGRDTSFNLVFIEYVDYIKLDLRKPLVTLDFSDF